MSKLKYTTYILITAVLLSVPLVSNAAISNWQKGVSIRPNWNTDFSSDSFKKSVDNAKNANANYVTLIIPYKQANVWATDLYPDWNTPTDASLAAGVQYIRSKGMAVNIKIHLESDDGQWRANINPGDRTRWFTNYKTMLSHYASLAQANNVEEMTIGAELINMSADSANGSNTQNWRDLISYIRTIFSGKLTYSANWGSQGQWVDEKNRIKFWDALDYIGISAYFPLTTNDTSVQAYTQKWDAINKNDIANLRNTYNKPILFTEVGYRSMNWAQWEPFNYWAGGGFDEGNQSRLYEALFSYWNNYDYMVGVQLWDWNSNPNAGGQGDMDYTPQNKLAEGTMRTWFAGGGGVTPPPAPTKISFTQSVAVNPTMTTINTPVQITATITNTGDAINNTIADVEVYDSTNAKIHQQFFASQNFTANQARQYTVNWTPTKIGSYTVVIGVFNNNWTQNYLWNANTASISVAQNTPPPVPPPSSGTINIWWPSSGITASGVQPFKAMVEGLDVSQYTMYWQVDGGQLNSMMDSNVDYPHKEALVDVSLWGWKGAGPYNITFIAKNAQGSVIAQGTRSINVY
ncbi:MAG TPA: hypothetical protein DCS29_01850 [Candidatus Magasanikbacteria bacterium]|nr:MAG: hypothetical protein A2479_01530 [Candidatus Magasanikbacteria bacterium RIFOXYC2_FULL_39_8]HAT03501.1 hypothetical protein [Candidatus Magasanikbacteria bacterium]